MANLRKYSGGSGGKTERVWTDENGIAVILFDPDVFGDLFVMASHPEARIGGRT